MLYLIIEDNINFYKDVYHKHKMIEQLKVIKINDFEKI